MRIEEARASGIYKMLEDETVDFVGESHVVIPKGTLVQILRIEAESNEVIIQNLTENPHTTRVHHVAPYKLGFVTLSDIYPDMADTQPAEAHYAAMPIQPLEVMQAIMPRHELMGFIKGNIIKYSMRAGHKQGESAAKDAAKAKRYAEWLSIVDSGGFIDFNKPKEDK